MKSFACLIIALSICYAIGIEARLVKNEKLSTSLKNRVNNETSDGIDETTQEDLLNDQSSRSNDIPDAPSNQRVASKISKLKMQENRKTQNKTELESNQGQKYHKSGKSAMQRSKNFWLQRSSNSLGTEMRTSQQQPSATSGHYWMGDGLENSKNRYQRDESGDTRMSSDYNLTPDQEIDLLTRLTIAEQQNRKNQGIIATDLEAIDDVNSEWILSSDPKLVSLRLKISQRLMHSGALLGNVQMQQRIHDIADEKFAECNTGAQGFDKACAGRATGQIMQLIGALEKRSHPVVI